MQIDVHQHFWTEPLIDALASRRELPFVRSEHGLTVLYLAGERSFVLDLATESYDQRAALVERDGLDRALLCLSSPLGIESLPREQALPLLDAYHDGALSLSEPFGVWGALALDRPDASDIDQLLDRAASGYRSRRARSPASSPWRACIPSSRVWSRAARRCSSTPAQVLGWRRAPTRARWRTRSGGRR